MGTKLEQTTNIEVVLERISGLHQDVNELKESTRESMRDIASAINKLVTLEERQSNNNEATSRLLSQIEKLDQRLQVIERGEDIKKLTSKWMLAAVWSIAVAAMGYCAKLLGVY